MRTSASGSRQRDQATIEYMAMYGVAILIICTAFVFLYSFLTLPSTTAPNTCQFQQAALCIDSVIGTNTVTSNTAIALFLENSADYPMTSPAVIVRMGTKNTSAACQPNYVKPGGVVLCIVNLSQKTSVGAMVNGNLYLVANNCGMSNSSGRACVGVMRETYMGSFSGHAQAIESYTPSITINATANTLPPNGQQAVLMARVTFLGSTITGATVNFTANNTVPILGGLICGSTNTLVPCSSFSNSNGQGVAQSSIWSYKPVSVTVFANFSGASASTKIIFNNANTLLARQCSTKGSGTLYSAVVTTANDAYYDPLNVNPATLGIYTLLDHATGLPIVINVNGNGNGAGAAGNCFSVTTVAGDGPVTLSQNGNNENSILLVSGPAAVDPSNNGNSGDETVSDSGTGPVTGTDNGNGGTFILSSGTGSLNLNVNGNNQAVSNITTASSNVVFGLNGNSQSVNITDTASGANVAISENGNSQKMNLSWAPGTTITVSEVNGNTNTFNSLGGDITFVSIGGNNNVLNLVNEVVYIASCSGNSNKINLIGSIFAAGSPYNAGTTACPLTVTG